MTKLGDIPNINIMEMGNKEENETVKQSNINMLQSNEGTELFTDFQQISPWNTEYVKRFQSVKKPWYKYLFGTMPDLHNFSQRSTTLLLIFAFFRSFGMFIGISNPFLGACVLLSVAMDNVYIFVFYCVAVISGIFWCFYLKINKEMIYNGLYPAQAIMVSVYMTLVHDKNANLWTLLPILFIMALVQIVTFQTLCELFVIKLKCSPSIIAGILWSLIFMVATRGSFHFNTNLNSSGFVTIWDPPAINVTLGLTGRRYMWETLRGAAFYSATTNVWGAIPLYIGVVTASPILAIGMWVGSFLGVGCAWIMGISPEEMFNGAYGVNGAVLFANLSSVYFVLNIHSVIISIMGTFATVLGCIAMNYFLAPSGVGCSVLPSILVLIMVYLSRHHFPRLIPVELVCITTPEDHVTRYLLSQRIVRHLDIRKHLHTYKNLSGDKLQKLERGLLPILMCSYVARDDRNNLSKLLLYGANPNSKDYDGRSPLHIAAAENRAEIAALLLKYQNDINSTDNFGNTALHDALNSQNWEIAQFLFSNGGRIFMDSEKLAPKLCNFIANNEHQALGEWLKCGIDSNVTDYDKKTPLDFARARNNKHALGLLTRYGARSGLRDNWGYVSSGKTDECIVIELAAKLDYSRQLSMESFKKQHKTRELADVDLIAAVLLALLDNNDVEHSNSLIPSLLCTAASCGFDDIIREVIPRLKDPNPADYDERTPLHLAAESGYVTITRLLVKNGADINVKDRFGNTPLTSALLNNNYEVAKYLKQSGGKLLLSNDMAAEIIFSIILRNNIEKLEAFYHAGIDISVTDYDGRTAIGQAKDIGSKSILNFLNSLKIKEQYNHLSTSETLCQKSLSEHKQTQTKDTSQQSQRPER